MKKFLSAAVISLALIGCAYAGDNISRGFISVSTEAVEEMSPTDVKISFAIQNEAKEAQMAADINKETSKKVIDSVKEMVDLKKGETIKTTSYYLNPQYIYKDGIRRQTGYIASNTLQVSLKDAEKAGKIISTALANGANSVNNLQFSLDDANEDCNKLIQKAANGAKIRAEKIAESTGSVISGLKSINAGCSSSGGFQSNFRMMNYKAEAVMDSAAGAVPLEAGKSQLRAYVNAEFFVK